MIVYNIRKWNMQLVFKDVRMENENKFGEKVDIITD